MEQQGKNKIMAISILSVVSFFLVILMFLVGGWSNSSLFDGREIRSQKVEVQVLEDGTLDVVEQTEYLLKDKNGVFRNYTYDKNKNQTIKIISVEVNDSRKVEETQVARKGSKGLYTFSDDNKTQELKIFEPTNGVLKTRVHYQAKGLITEYNDMQMLDWTFYDSNGAQAPLNMAININFPTPVAQEDMKVFGHGNLEGKVLPASPGVVTVDIPKFSENTFGIVTVLLPTKPLTAVTNKKAEDKYQEALSFELASAQKTDEQIGANKAKEVFAQRLQVLLKVGILVLTILGTISLFYSFRKIYLLCDKEKYKVELDYYREVGAFGPAVASLICDPERDVDQEQLAAVIFNLYTLGKIAIDVKKMDDTMFIKILDHETADLNKSEAYVLKWLIAVGGDEEFSYRLFMCDTKETRNMENQEVFMTKYKMFCDIVAREFASLGHMQYLGRKIKITNPAFGIGFVIILCSMISYYFVSMISLAGIQFAIGVIMFINAGLVFGYMSMCSRYTQEGALLHAQYKGLKNFLEDYSLLNEAPVESIIMWQKYFVYGIALGVTDKALKELYAKLPIAKYENGSNPDIVTIVMMNRLLNQSQFRIYNSQTINTTNQSIREFTASRSSGGSSLGGGGGFSGGSSFGGGGGGGGGGSF
ncbi:MAG: DUF2207 family protein [Culicoidibacterales bacterium]